MTSFALTLVGPCAIASGNEDATAQNLRTVVQLLKRVPKHPTIDQFAKTAMDMLSQLNDTTSTYPNFEISRPEDQSFDIALGVA